MILFLDLLFNLLYFSLLVTVLSLVHSPAPPPPPRARAFLDSHKRTKYDPETPDVGEKQSKKKFDWKVSLIKLNGEDLRLTENR